MFSYPGVPQLSCSDLSPKLRIRRVSAVLPCEIIEENALLSSFVFLPKARRMLII